MTPFLKVWFKKQKEKKKRSSSIVLFFAAFPSPLLSQAVASACKLSCRAGFQAACRACGPGLGALLAGSSSRWRQEHGNQPAPAAAGPVSPPGGPRRAPTGSIQPPSILHPASPEPSQRVEASSRPEAPVPARDPRWRRCREQSLGRRLRLAAVPLLRTRGLELVGYFCVVLSDLWHKPC